MLYAAMAGTATARIRARLREMSQSRAFTQTAVAKRLGIDQASVNRYVHGPTPLTVTFLEAVAEETQIPLGELVAPPGSYKQLDAEEAALLRYLRRWPKSVMRALIAFVAFFADEPPAAVQTRNMHELWRRMPTKQREVLYGVAVLIRERTLSPELQARILGQLAVDLSGGGDEREATTATDDDETP